MRTISQRELRNFSGQVLRDLAAGEELLVTSNGDPVGVLRMSPPPDRRRRFVPAADVEAALAPVALAPEERERLLSDIRETDGDERDPWTRAADA